MSTISLNSRLQAIGDRLKNIGLGDSNHYAAAMDQYAPQIVMRGDIHFFATFYVRPYVSDWLVPPPAHEDIYRWLNVYDRLLLEASRDFAKSTLVSMIYPLFKIVTNPNIRILLITGSGDNAAKFVHGIKWHLENNERLISHFGSLKSRTSKWCSDQFTVVRPDLLKEPTFKAIGWQSHIVGGRYDLVILDDIEDSKNARTPDHGQARIHWLENDILPMLKGGQMVVVQPYQGAHDLHRLLRKKGVFEFKKIPAQDKDGNSAWPTRMPLHGNLKICPHKEKSYEEFPCEDCKDFKLNKFKRIACGYCREGGTDLPKGHGCKRCPIPKMGDKIVCLTMKRIEVAEYNYKRQYLLDESVEEDKLFNRDKFQTYQTLPAGSYRCVHGYDLATGKNDKGCDFGYTRIMINNYTGNIYVEKSVGLRYKITQQMRLIETNNKNFGHITTVHGIETNAYQHVLFDYYNLLSTIPVKPILTVQDKFTRATQLTVFYDAGRIYHKEGACDVLEDQLENFEAYGPKKHKDVFDSLYMAIRADGVQGAGLVNKTEVDIAFSDAYQDSRSDFGTGSQSSVNMAETSDLGVDLLGGFL